jgi:hypothetical protein
MLALLLACTPAETEGLGPDVVDVTVETPERQETREQPRYTQEQLTHRSDAVTVSGTIACDAPGPYWVRVYPLHPESRYLRVGQLPGQGFLSEIEVAEAGAFETLTLSGDARLILALSGPVAEPTVALADLHASYMPLPGDLSQVVLDCSIEPTVGDAPESIGVAGATVMDRLSATRAPPDPAEVQDWLERTQGSSEPGDPELRRRRKQMEDRFGAERVADLGPLLEFYNPDDPSDLAELEKHMAVGVDE